MTRFLSAALAATLLIGVHVRAADDPDPKAVLDKAIKALGGEDKLSKVKAATAKANGKITFGGNDNEFTTTSTFQGLDHVQQTFEGDINGNKVRGVLVLDGDKGWRLLGDMKETFDKDSLANEKRNVYLQIIPVTLLPLKDKAFKVEAAKEEKVNDKPAIGLKVTGPEKKEFTLYFDKESGLPVKLVAKVVGFMGDEYNQETTYGDYKEFDGIKKATKIESTRNGEKFIEQHVTEFKVLDKVDPKTFEEPK